MHELYLFLHFKDLLFPVYFDLLQLLHLQVQRLNLSEELLLRKLVALNDPRVLAAVVSLRVKFRLQLCRPKFQLLYSSHVRLSLPHKSLEVLGAGLELLLHVT